MTNEDTSTYTGDWISWFAGLCNTTFITVEDFYSCVETQHLYTKQEIVFNHSSFSFVTARPVGLFNITWEDFIESLGKFTIIHFTNKKINLKTLILFPIIIYIHQTSPSVWPLPDGAGHGRSD